jgi:hypothetical protein
MIHVGSRGHGGSPTRRRPSARDVMDSSRLAKESWRPLPGGSKALAATPAPIRPGVWAARISSRGDPSPSRGKGGNGPDSRPNPPASIAFAAWSWDTTESTGTPQRSAAANTLPALVPTTRSASASEPSQKSSTAGMAPAIQAAPRMPPAPSTDLPAGAEAPLDENVDRSPYHTVQPTLPGRRLTAVEPYKTNNGTVCGPAAA